MLYRRTQENALYTGELDIAMLDGCEIIWLAAPKKYWGKDGKVRNALKAEVMKLAEPDASGRRSPVPTGEEFTLEVDMLIKAAGQMPF